MLAVVLPDISELALYWAGVGGKLVLVLLAAIVGLRLARLFVHGAIAALMRREATEGTAQELSAIELKKRTDTIETLAVNVVQFFIVVIATLDVLDTFSINIAPAIAGLGIVGIAVGFGAQSLVKDYFNGALILLENQFSRGDNISIAGVTGTVEDFTLRRTTLRDMDGVVHTVPNSQITVTSNHTRVWARINQAVTVAYGTDIERATQVVDDVGREIADDPVWKRRILERPHVEGVDALAELGVTLKILGAVRADDQWSVGSELRKRLLAAFAENGIRIPQQRQIVFARDEAADAAKAAGDAAKAAHQAEAGDGTKAGDAAKTGDGAAAAGATPPSAGLDTTAGGRPRGRSGPSQDELAERAD
jgi:small conductance mechanosensitive channel